MITSGDIQFEPPASKIIPLTTSIFIMASGDTAFHNEIMKNVTRDVNIRVNSSPSDWWLVKDIVDLYIKHTNASKLERAETSILAPLNLDRHSFLTSQNFMEPNLVGRIAEALINFEVPQVTTIISGIDKDEIGTHPHIYTISNSDITCDDLIGFSSIGIGSRHAEAEFMLCGHAWNSSLPETLFLTYSAKRNAQIAPGVGTGTDMWLIGPGLGQHVQVSPEPLKTLEQEYRRRKGVEKRALARANERFTQYVVGLTQKAAQAQQPSSAAAGSPPTEESEETDAHG